MLIRKKAPKRIITKFERCPIKGCGVIFPSLKEAVIHFARVKHCKECGFGEVDLSGLAHVFNECFACAFLDTMPPSDVDYLFN